MLPVRAYYHSNAGGHTENIENVWGGSSEVPMRGVASAWDNLTPWQVTYTQQQVVDFANRYGDTNIGRLVDIKTYYVDDRGIPTVSGRVFKLEIIGERGTVTALRDGIRGALGGLNSTFFSISMGGSGGASIAVMDVSNAVTQVSNVNGLMAVGASGVAESVGSGGVHVIGASGVQELNRSVSVNVLGNLITITGTGSGHGVGMSQVGARGMAAEGYSYKEILAYYYFAPGGNYAIAKIGAY